MTYKLDMKPIQSYLLIITVLFITNKTTYLGLIYANNQKISSKSWQKLSPAHHTTSTSQYLQRWEESHFVPIRALAKEALFQWSFFSKGMFL